MTRRQVLTLAAAAVASPAHAQTETSGVVGVEVRARPIPAFEARDPTRLRFGALAWRGGIQLLSSHRDFGGISGFRTEPDGERFLSVTDKGFWLRGRIVYEGTQPSGIADAEMAPLLNAEGRPVQKQRWYDSEALAEDAGIVHVAFERVHQILRFDYARDGLLARGWPVPVPREFRQLRSNKGIEALVAVPKGQQNAGKLLALAERGREEADDIPGFIIGDSRPGAFSLRRLGDYDVTDAAITPGGDLIVLERYFSYMRGVAMRMRRIRLGDIAPGAIVDGPVIVEADMGYQIDNMEALSIHRAASGETVLTLVSDDNFSPLQRTLLLQFTLAEG